MMHKQVSNRLQMEKDWWLMATGCYPGCCSGSMGTSGCLVRFQIKALETSGGTSVARIKDNSWSACHLTSHCVQYSCASKSVWTCMNMYEHYKQWVIDWFSEFSANSKRICLPEIIRSNFFNDKCGMLIIFHIVTILFQSAWGQRPASWQAAIASYHSILQHHAASCRVHWHVTIVMRKP